MSITILMCLPLKYKGISTVKKCQRHAFMTIYLAKHQEDLYMFMQILSRFSKNPDIVMILKQVDDI